MTNPRHLAAALLAVALLAGCGKKAVKTTPPAPGTASSEDANAAAGAAGEGGVAGTGPGSAADFERSVPATVVFFALDSFELDDNSRRVLDSQAQWLARYPNIRVTIEGHTDERGTREYNLALSDRRANAAKNYLAARGVDASRMTVISWGKERPVAVGSNEEGYAQNRRAVTVVPVG